MTDRHDPEMEALLDAMRSDWRPAATDPTAFDEGLHRRIRRRRVRNAAVASTLAVAAVVALTTVIGRGVLAPGDRADEGEVITFAEVVTDHDAAADVSATAAADALPGGWQLAASEEPGAMDLPDEYEALSTLFLGSYGGGS